MRQVLIALDQLLNAMLGGWADETLSARAHREGWSRWIDLLFFWQPEHCKNSYLSEMNRAQMPPVYRGKPCR